jgi:hypothetical protein
MLLASLRGKLQPFLHFFTQSLSRDVDLGLQYSHDMLVNCIARDQINIGNRMMLPDPMTSILGLYSCLQVEVISIVNDVGSGSQSQTIPGCLWIADEEPCVSVLELLDSQLAVIVRCVTEV